jgi:hypothetical protein
VPDAIEIDIATGTQRIPYAQITKVDPSPPAITITWSPESSMDPSKLSVHP